MSAREPSKLRQSVPDNAVPVILAGIAFGGSFAHWVNLAESHGQKGLLAPAVAICVDLGALMCARERERDLREQRGKKGWASWPTIGMTLAILLTLAGNVASAQHTPWGVISALIPGAFLLLAISLMERRANERHRRNLASAAVAAERAEEDRQAAETRRRAEERQRDLAERHSQIVTRPSPLSVTPGAPSPSPRTVTQASPRTVTQGPPRLSLTAVPADGDGGSATSGVAVMRAFWDREVAAGRIPTGADLLRAAGLSPASSLGRRKAAMWSRELDGEASA